MSLLNKKVQQSNSSNKHNSIVKSKNDFFTCKNYLKNIKVISNKLNGDSKRKNEKIRITDINQNYLKKANYQGKYIDNKNIKIKDFKKSKKMQLFFSIKNADTLTIKNNNFKSFHNNYINKFHSFENLNNQKNNLNSFSMSNNSIHEKKKK